MNTKKGFAAELKKIRKARGLTQEDFSDISSRTYLSTLERAIKSPTLDKVDAIASTLQVHPLTLLFLTYANLEKNDDLDGLVNKVQYQIQEIDRQSLK